MSTIITQAQIVFQDIAVGIQGLLAYSPVPLPTAGIMAVLWGLHEEMRRTFLSLWFFPLLASRCSWNPTGQENKKDA